MNALIGVLGGGQLGRMLALAGYPLGARFRFFDPAPDATAGDLATIVTGAYEDPDAIARFGAGLTVATYEFENVPVAAVEQLGKTVPIYPPPRALAVSQDRLIEKEFFRGQGIATAPFAVVDSRSGLESAEREFGLPLMLKTRRMGYDGKGQAIVRDMEDAEFTRLALGGNNIIAEGFVTFRRELSVLSVRGHDGAIAFYPLTENQHRDGILWQSLAPAPDSTALQPEAEEIARRVLQTLDYVGVLAIELFEHQGRLLANEMAPRVHNSGHWTIEGAETSQFANHVRAVLGLPLGSSAPRGLSAMVNIIGDLPDSATLLSVPGARLHLYGKAPRPGRKLGHVTVVADSAAQLEQRVQQVTAVIG